MKKAYNIKILLLFILLSGTDVLSQENCGVVSVNTSHSGEDYNYISKEKISLKTGFSFSSSGGKVFNAKTDPYMLCELSAREEYNETNPYQHSKNLPVGTIPGAAGVSATGAATYEIPVFVSPGTAGMEPSVSIVYNSQSGNGLLGVGWNLSGLSAISMSPDLYYSEGHFEAVKFNNDGSTKDKYVEKYSFDGNPLVFTGESNNTEEFRTELESFRKITFTGNKFTVQTKDGIKSYYGSNDNSRLKLSSESGNRTLVWYIDKIEDNNGNYIKYEYYDNYNNEKLIKRISYTGNQNANLAPYNHIEFYYAERSDKSSNYVSGKEFKQSVVLEKIIVKHMGYLVKEYKFGYFVDPYTKLNEVTEYNGSGSKYNSTVIEWGEKDYGLSVSAIDNWSEITCSTGWYNINTQRVTGDFNGDGIDDLIIAGSFFDPSNTTDICTSGRLYLGSTGGLVLSEKFSVPFKATIYVIRTGPDHFYYTGLDRKDVIVFASRDPLSRDRVGILKENNISGYEWEINSTGTSSKYEIFIPGNFYENGTPCYLNTYTYTENWDNESWKRLSNIEIRYVKDDGNIGYKNITNPFNNSGKYHILDRNSSRDNFPKCNIDFDGDGVAEIIGIHEANGQKKVRIYEFDKYTEDFELLYDVPSSVIDPVNLQSNNNWFLFGDFNGDGKTDIFCKLINTYWKIYYSTGKGFTEGSDFTSELESNSGSDPSYKIYVADMNGDGLADIVEFKGYDQNNQRINKLLIHLNTGDGFYKIENGTINSYISNDEYFTIGDFNGDGKKDIIYFAGLLEQQFKISGFMLNDESRSVKKITNGIGHKTEFDYALMTEYNTGSNGINIYNDDYNYVSLLSPLKVVKKIRQPSGINNTMSESEYGYKDGLIHIKGKGFLGFEEVHSSNSTLNRFTKTINKFDFAYSAVNETETIVQTIDNENISKDRTKFLIRQMASSPPAWICVVPLFTSSWDYLYGSDNDSTLTTYEYYNQTGGTFLGNVKKVETNHTGCFTTKTEYEYNPSCLSLDNWNISKPVKITESRIQNGTHAMRNILTYDNKGNLTETTSDSYPVSGGYPLRRVYSYDACGNLLMSGGVGKVVIEAIDQYRTERYEYDELYRFVVKKIDKMNMSENMSYDPFFGNVLTKNDIFGNTTTYRYDKFGNLIQVISPRDNVTSISCLWSSGLNDVGVYKIITSSDGAPTIRSYYDILGRELRTTSDFYGETLVTEKTYSQDGLVEKENLPYFENSPTDNYKEYSYDNNKRLTSVTSMGLTTNYIHGSETLETIYPDSRQETKNYNKAGQLTSISSFNGDVSYTYHSSGNPSGITAGGSTTIMGYDKYGNQIRLTDVNTGQVNYTYNAFGELIIQTDAKLNKFRLYYDTGGRLVKKECYNNPEFTVNYTYYFSHNNLCLLKKEEMGNGTYKEYEYDEYANPVKISEYIDGELYTHEYTYDRYNNLISYKSPSSFTLTNHYDPQGFLVRVEHNGDVIWKLSGNSVNEMGQFLNYKLGPNEINCIFTYNNYYELTSQSYGQDFHYSYEWDHNEGNLLSRTDNITEMREEFEYNDNMDRLTGWMVYDAPYNQPISSYSAEYSPNGNIHYKTDIGYYTYDGTKIHAVTEISGAEPEFVPERNQITEYTPFNKVSSITEEDPLTGEVLYRYEIIYGPDQERKITKLYNGETLVKTRYYSGLYEKEISGGTTCEIDYITGGDGTAGARFMYNSNADNAQIWYFAKDHLGSVLLIFDEEDNPSERFSFDPWGSLRNPNNWGYNNLNTGFLSYFGSRGFTGHEHLPEFGLINMNGRMYDPALGRMLSPDNYVQSPGNAQNYNRYSYCLNNPLKYTDPSGDWIWIAVGVGALVGAYIGGSASNEWDMNPVQWNWSSGQTWAGIGLGAVIGGVAGAGFYYAAPWLAQTGFFSYFGSSGTVAAYTLAGSATLGAGGYGAGLGGGMLYSGGDWGYSHQSGMFGAMIGSSIGGAAGYVAGNIENYKPSNPLQINSPTKPKWDGPFFQGTEEEASQFLLNSSKMFNVETSYWYTSRGYYFDPIQGESLGYYFEKLGNNTIISDYNYKLGYSKNTIRTTVRFTNIYKLNEQMYIYPKNNFTHRAVVYHNAHTHPKGFPPSNQDRLVSSWLGIPGIVFGWNGKKYRYSAWEY